PEHRSAGAALALQRALTRESRGAGFDCLIGKPNRKASPIFRRVGYRPVGQSTEWVKALDPQHECDEHPSGVYTGEILTAADGRAWIALSYLGASAFGDRLQELGFARKNRLHTVLTYIDAECDADLHDAILDVDNSLVFGGEMDLF